MNKIPKIIHLCSQTKNIPDIYKSYLFRMISLHPKWDFYLHDDEQMYQIMESEFPEFLTIYQSYSNNIQRVDFFRVLIVYLLGGFYMDMDMFCYKKLDDLCNKTIVLREERICTNQEISELELLHPMQIANYMFGSIPKHPFWENVIAEMVSSIKTENDRTSSIK